MACIYGESINVSLTLYNNYSIILLEFVRETRVIVH